LRELDRGLYAGAEESWGGTSARQQLAPPLEKDARTATHTDLVYQARLCICNPKGELRLGMPVTVLLAPNAPPPDTAALPWGRTAVRVDSESVLSATGLTKGFCAGGRAILALDAVDLEARSGVVTGLIGPDGAGKTCTSPGG
jgi:ABC-type glutathione transport system ATPase component